MGSNSSKTSKEERKGRNDAIDTVTKNATEAIDRNTQQYAETILQNSQRDGNDQPIIRQEDRDYMQTQFMINETKKTQLQRKTDPFTKNDWMAVLARLNGMSDVQAIQFSKLTVPDLRAAVRQCIYNPNITNSTISKPITSQERYQPQQRIKNTQRNTPSTQSTVLVTSGGSRRNTNTLNANELNANALDIVLRK